MIRFILCSLACLTIIACASSSPEVNEGSPEPDRDYPIRHCDPCTQPPIKQDELVDHLKKSQPRILAREDYKKNLPPPVSTIIYGNQPDGPLRPGDVPRSSSGEEYSGVLSWHQTPFEEVNIPSSTEPNLGTHQTLGAHCFFAQRANEQTALFTILIAREDTGEDRLFFAGPDHRTTPLSDDLFQVDAHRLICAFRDDENRVGAVILPHRVDGQLHYGLWLITLSTERRPTGRTRMVEATADRRSQETTLKEVPIKKYPDPRVEFVDHLPDLYDALSRAEEILPEGNFRLRPSSIYPAMTYRPYLHGGEPQFCPVRTTCVEERQHFDDNLLPARPARDDAADEGDEPAPTEDY